jgi:hypothetical protein
MPLQNWEERTRNPSDVVKTGEAIKVGTAYYGESYSIVIFPYIG